MALGLYPGAPGAVVLAQLSLSTVTPREPIGEKPGKKTGQRRRPGWRLRQGLVSTIFCWYISAFSLSHILTGSGCPSASWSTSEAAVGSPHALGTGNIVDQTDMVPMLMDTPDQQERQILIKIL